MGKSGIRFIKEVFSRRRENSLWWLSIFPSKEKDVLSIENVKDYSLLGVNEFNSSSISYLVSIECAPNKGYQIKRDYYGLILKYFKENNIEIPYNKIDVNIRRNNE